LGLFAEELTDAGGEIGDAIGLFDHGEMVGAVGRALPDVSGRQQDLDSRPALPRRARQFGAAEPFRITKS